MNVFEIQSHLLDMGMKPGAVDGIAGAKTRAGIARLLDRYAPTSRVDRQNMARMLVAAEQVILRQIGGLEVGPIDGIVGKLTERARVHWLNGPWRVSSLKALPGDARFPTLVKTAWPLQTQMEKFYGAPNTGQVLLYTPYPLELYNRGGDQILRFSCHSKVKDSLLRVMNAALAHYGYDRLRELRLDIFGGCLNVRTVRGGKALSTHAYGAAVDWDPSLNALKSTRATARMARPEYAAWWDMWTAEGWLSLGKARDYDWMHVQAARLG